MRSRVIFNLDYLDSFAGYNPCYVYTFLVVCVASRGEFGFEKEQKSERKKWKNIDLEK